MKAVGDLRGLRRARTSTVTIRFQAISGDNRDTGMCTSPVGQRLRLTVVQQCYWPPLS